MRNDRTTRARTTRIPSVRASEMMHVSVKCERPITMQTWR